MKKDEFEKMYRAETRFWWFVGKGRLTERLARRWFPAQGLGLDVGCGCGANLERLSGGMSWLGLDPSGDALTYCAERGHRLLTLAGAERLPFDDGVFDAMTALDVLEHLDEDSLAAGEMFRCLREGGRLLVTVPAYPLLWSSHDDALGHKRRYRKAGLCDLLSRAGFRVLWTSHFMALLFPLMAAGKAWQMVLGDREKTIDYDWPDWINRWILIILGLELNLLDTIRMPMGSTLVAVCEKPRAATLAGV